MCGDGTVGTSSANCLSDNRSAGLCPIADSPSAEGHHSRHGNLSTVVGEVDGDADEEGRNVPPFAEWSG